MREVEARLKISAVDRTGKVLANIGNRLQDVNRRADAFNRTQSTISTQMQAMSINLPTAAALIAAYEIPTRVGRELARATAAAADFETALFNIQKKSGASKEEVAKLGDEIRQLSREMPLSRDEIAAGMERGAAAGIPIAELKEFTRMTAMIANGWEVTTEESGNFIAGFNKGLNIPIKDMQAYASLINDLADSGIADEKDIADFADRAGAGLMNFGMTPNEVAAYGASFLNLKMPAEVAARAIQALTGKMMAPENLAPKSRKALGAIVGDLKQFSKLSGNEKMTKLITSLNKMTNQRKASLLGALLGEGFSDEIMRLVNGSDEIARNLEMAHKQAVNPSNSIVTTYLKQLETFNELLKLTKGKLSDIELSLGNRILPFAHRTLTSVSKALDDEDAWDRGKDKLGWSQDKDLYWNSVDDFRKQYQEKISAKAHDLDAAVVKAITQLGYGDIKTLDDFIANEIARTDPKGQRAKQHGLYRPGRGPENILGADNPKYSLDNPPLPLARPTAREIADFKQAQTYLAAGAEHAAKGDPEKAAIAEMRNEAMGDDRGVEDDMRRIAEARREQEIAGGRAEKLHRLRGDDQRAPVFGRFPLDDREREIAEGRAEKIRRLRGDENREPAFPMKKPRTILGSIFQENDDSGDAADKVASSLEQGGQKIKDGADAGGQKIEQSGTAFAEAIARASTNLTQAVAQAAAMLANLKVNVNTVGGVIPSKVNANTGKTNEFVKGPNGMGPR